MGHIHQSRVNTVTQTFFFFNKEENHVFRQLSQTNDLHALGRPKAPPMETNLPIGLEKKKKSAVRITLTIIIYLMCLTQHIKST